MLTVPELGVTLILVFGMLYWLGRMPTVTALAGGLGVIMLGEAGWFGRILAGIASGAQRLLGAVMFHVLGYSFIAATTVALLILLAHDLHPRNTTGRRTAWAGIALGALIVGGATGIPALAGAEHWVDSLASSILSM